MSLQITLLVYRKMWTPDQNRIDTVMSCTIYFDKCGSFILCGSRNERKYIMLIIFIIHQLKTNSHMNQRQTHFVGYASWWGWHDPQYFLFYLFNKHSSRPLRSVFCNGKDKKLCDHVIQAGILTKKLSRRSPHAGNCLQLNLVQLFDFVYDHPWTHF